MQEQQGVYFKSTATNSAANGVIRLASGDQACWRNAANTGDVCINKTAGDVLQFSGIPIAQTIGTGAVVMTMALLHPVPVAQLLPSVLPAF
jgi:hypothetical protein